MDTAAKENVGVSSYERIRLAIVYIEAAAELEESQRMGNSDSLTALIKELSLKTTEGKVAAK